MSCPWPGYFLATLSRAPETLLTQVTYLCGQVPSDRYTAPRLVGDSSLWSGSAAGGGSKGWVPTVETKCPRGLGPRPWECRDQGEQVSCSENPRAMDACVCVQSGQWELEGAGL